ncbi:sulfotransferase family protein [Lichenicola sp.]|uniref:sulfotransferase family protein n=1 Tax=Lichenicola sp. TaxID=2804529 RepID=UPI003AFFC20D
MHRTIHFIAGLPRSGSTLLAALLRQNPLLHASMSSPLAVLCERILPVMGSGEYATLFDDERRRGILSGLIDSYHDAGDAALVRQPQVVFDTNRAWCAHMRVLADVRPDAFVIACVRDPVWIIDSFERLFRTNTYLVSKLHGIPNSGTVFDRVEQLMAVTGAFGAAWQALQDAYYGEFAHRLILVDYDELVAEPLRVLAVLYDLLELAPFTHDPEALDDMADAGFDAALNTPGLHRVRRRVQQIHRRTVLPPQIVKRLADTMFWRGTGAGAAQNPGGAFIIAPDEVE